MNERVPQAVAILSALALLWIVVPGEAVKERRNYGHGPAGGGSRQEKGISPIFRPHSSA